jgi:hypothetical protein
MTSKLQEKHPARDANFICFSRPDISELPVHVQGLQY